MPKNRLLGLLVAALAIVPAAPALAGPTVSVRVEGQSATLLPATTVTLPDVKAAGNPCTDAGAARSVAAAIEEATGGNWDRQGFTQTILGETHAFAASDYWAEWVNDKFGGGICSDVVQTGDRILMLVDVSGPPPTYSSTVFPLGLDAPGIVAPGASFAVTATEYRTDGTPGTSTPTLAAGVSISGGAAPVSTGPDGRATVRLDARGPASLRAARSSGSRSESVPVCVSDGADGFCGSTKPGTTPTPGPAPSPVVAPDKVAAFAKLAVVGEQQRFAAGRGPRTLRGRVDDDASGVSDVRLRLSRTDGPRCSRYDGARERFVTTKACGVTKARTFSVGSQAAFSYLLPSALPRGRYVLDVIVVDRAGNQTTTYQRGRNRVVFFVA